MNIGVVSLKGENNLKKYVLLFGELKLKGIKKYMKLTWVEVREESC